jgi:phenylacetate-coenzyme A ligase PaaK-like adenylate-forming protein
MGRRAALLYLASDALRARAAGPEAIAARQRRRLADLLAWSRRVPFYRRLWTGIAPDAGLDALPPVTKKMWVESFDETVLDPEVRYETLWRHMQDVTRVGEPWLGRYSVCRSSGVSGKRSLFVLDQAGMDVCWSLWLTRAWLPWLRPDGVARFARRGGRVASLIATNGHFASAALIRRPSPIGAIANARSSTLSIHKPVGRIARALAHWQPAALVGYPTILDQLAVEQLEGRLALDVVLAVSVSEWVEAAARARIEAAFGCPLRDSYAASEFLAIGFGCPEGWLHVNADWVVLEPVDESFRPVPPGETSHTTLVTNLANRVQPVVRHDLDDRVTVRPDPCICGSPLPAVRVEGRRNDVLVFRHAGSRVSLAPMGLTTLLGSVPGIEMGAQYVQTDPRTLSLRIAFVPGTDESRAWAEVERRLRAHLRAHGLPDVDVVRSPIPPGRDPRTGKLLRIWSEAEIPAGSAI